MLTITVPGIEHFDETKQEFIEVDPFDLELEHSLTSLSKWESFWEVPFLTSREKTSEEILDYVKTMILSPEYPTDVVERLSQKNLTDINAYIDAKMTATWFSEVAPTSKGNSEVITAELIYHWMIEFGIPFECQSWHLNRLFTLIKVRNVKNAKPKKMSRSEVAVRNRELNEQRKAQMGTKG